MLLVIQNPGRVSRNYVEGIRKGLVALGHDPLVLEIKPFLELPEQDKPAAGIELARTLKAEGIQAAIGYACQGFFELPHFESDQGPIPFFSALDMQHLMLWTDHPHWYNSGVVLEPPRQNRLAHPCNCHVLKTGTAADEVEHVLGWSRCRHAHMAEDTDLLVPVKETPKFDVVTITAGASSLPDELVPMVDSEDPDCDDIRSLLAPGTISNLKAALSKGNVPSSIAEKIAERWCNLCLRHPDLDPWHHVATLQEEVGEKFQPILVNPILYYAARGTLERLHHWHRAFYIRYLQRYFSVGIWGTDSYFGDEAQGWVDYADQPKIYAQGRVALNICQGNDIEGLSHKPFQIAASGVPMVHPARADMDECFENQKEYMPFQTPAQARDAIQALLDSPQEARSMAEAARARVEKDHSWKVRMEQLLPLALK